MLERLRIRDLALVDDAEVTLEPGLNVITGETGAGKSLLVESLDLLLGGRADTQRVRAGATAAVVEGEFRLDAAAAKRVAPWLEEWGVEFDGETLIVRREVQAGGKSRALVNQSALTRGSLERLGEALADLHGQHEHQSLLRPGAGAELLDRLGALSDEASAYASAREAWRQASDALERLEASLATVADRRDWLTEARRELDEARIQPGEEDVLRVEAARLAHADRLRSLAEDALARLTEGESAAVDALAAAAHAVQQAAALDPSLAEVLPGMEEARIAAAESARSLADYASRLEADPSALESVEARRELLSRLSRKYRRPSDELITWRDEIARELGLSEDAETVLAEAQKRRDDARQACLAAGRAWSARRRAAARTWSARLTRELKPLGLPHAGIELVVEAEAEAAETLPARGLDDVEIRFGANVGEPARPLRNTASGGELSRVMLALKCALETQDPVDVLVFDEVDSGIGGAVAQAVGDRLRRLARLRQVVCVTHLPMIAALGRHHLLVTKRASGGRTHVLVEPLGTQGRIEEIARMLAGDHVTATTRRQARELIEAGAHADHPKPGASR